MSRYDRGASNALDFASPAQLARNPPAPRPTPPPGPPPGVTESGSWRWVWVPDRPNVRDELQTAGQSGSCSERERSRRDSREVSVVRTTESRVSVSSRSAAPRSTASSAPARAGRDTTVSRPAEPARAGRDTTVSEGAAPARAERDSTVSSGGHRRPAQPKTPPKAKASSRGSGSVADTPLPRRTTVPVPLEAATSTGAGGTRRPAEPKAKPAANAKASILQHLDLLPCQRLQDLRVLVQTLVQLD